MIVLLCVIAVIACLLLLLLCPIRVTLQYDEDLRVTLSYLCFRRVLYPEEDEVRLSDYTPRRVRRRRRKAFRKKQLEKQKAALQKKEKEKTEETSLRQKIRTVRLFLHILRELYRPVISAVRIRVYRLYAKVATEDAAKTAILYGVAAQGVAYLLELLEDHTKTKIDDRYVGVYADFCDTETAFDVKIRFSASPLRLLLVGAKALLLLFKTKDQNDDKNKNGVNEHERKQSE